MGTNWIKQILIFLVIFMLVGWLMQQGGCPAAQRQQPPQPQARFVTVRPAANPVDDVERLSTHSFAVRADLADTEAKRKQGMAGRGGLAPGTGMLYVYEEPQQPEFNWSTMQFPVSAAFMEEDGTIVGIHQADAQDPETYTPPKPIRYVLEVRRGWFEDRSIKAGDRMAIPRDEISEEPPAQPTGPADTPAPEEKNQGSAG